MNCEQMMEWMQRFVDDDLTQTEQEVLMKHVTQCPECAASFERLQLLSAELAHLPKITPPYSIVDSILPKLMELDAQQAAIKVAYLPTTKHGKKPISSWKIGAGLVAAAIIFSVIAFNLMPITNYNASDKAQSEQATAAKSNSDDKVSVLFDQAIGTEKDLNKPSSSKSPTVSTDARTYTVDASKSQKTVPASTPTPAPKPTPLATKSADLMFSKKSGANPSVQTLASEDGNFIALVERQIVQVQTPKGDRIYTSSIQWKPTDSIQFIQWLDNTRLVYEVKMEDGQLKRFIVDPVLKTEQEQKI
jgi:hypothetical protein